MNASLQHCHECGLANETAANRCQRCYVELSTTPRDETLIQQLVGPYRIESVRRCTVLGTAFVATNTNTDRMVELRLRLHDVAGNVWEWCLNVYGPHQRPVAEMTGERQVPPVATQLPVFRGGSGRDPARGARSAGRGTAAYRDCNLRLRPLRGLTTERPHSFTEVFPLARPGIAGSTSWCRPEEGDLIQ